MGVHRLVLGTARFGLDGHYGFQAQKPEEAVVAAIVERAWERGIHWLDTAAAYGDAEERLGRIGVGKWRITTKVSPNLWHDSTPPKAVYRDTAEEFTQSMARLGGVAPDAYLLHTSRYALVPRVLEAFLATCRALNSRMLAGVSCYSPEEAFAAMRAGCTAVQVPHNLLDMRARMAGVFVEAERRGVAVFARSPFCQGLLALARGDERVPEAYRERLGWWQAEAHRNAAVALSAALYGGTHPVVFGCESVEQVDENAKTALAPEPYAGCEPDWLQGVSDPVVNPSRFLKPPEGE